MHQYPVRLRRLETAFYVYVLWLANVDLHGEFIAIQDFRHSLDCEEIRNDSLIASSYHYRYLLQEVVQYVGRPQEAAGSVSIYIERLVASQERWKQSHITYMLASL